MAPKWGDDGTMGGGFGPAESSRADVAQQFRMIDDRGRLAAAHAAFEPAALETSDVDRFVDRLVGDDWSGEGETPIVMIVAAARRLGDRWDDDSCTFWDVTIGMARLSQELMAMDRAAACQSSDPLGRILIAPAPGDQHGLGVATVATALRNAGWDVTADIESDPRALIDAVRRDHFAVVGLSVGHERALGPTARLISDLRARSKNPDLRIALGGAVLNGRSELARSLGADIHSDDAAGFVAAADAVAMETRMTR